VYTVLYINVDIIECHLKTAATHELTNRKEEEEADRFLTKVDDVTSLMKQLLSKDQSEVCSLITKNAKDQSGVWSPRTNQR
jgi:hypothetical protein